MVIRKVIAMRPFVRQLKVQGLKGYAQEITTAIRDNPFQGSVIPGTPGLRKVRFALKGSGKRGGLRILYLVVVVRGEAFLLGVIKKSKYSDFSREAISVACELARSIKHGRTEKND